MYDFILGLITLLGIILAIAVGVEARRTIAIQCITGRSFDKYLFFNGPVLLHARYAGMKLAFGNDKEIFIPERAGAGSSWTAPMMHPPLRRADYDTLVLSAHDKSTVPRSNEWLTRRGRFPIWRWLQGSYGTLICVLLAALAFLPVVVLAIASWVAGSGGWIAAIIHLAVFVLFTVFDGALLDVRREVSYIRVDRTSVSPELEDTWFALHHGASIGPPLSPSDAARELATGTVRKHDKELLVPVMSLKPSVEWGVASWLFILAPFRIPLIVVLTASLGVPSAYQWVIAHWFCVFAQACLQNGLVNSFGSVADTRGIVWFRRLPGHEYSEELEEYQRVLC